MKLNYQDIQRLDKFYRTNLITKISGLRTPFLIGSINEEGQSNLAIFNSVVHIGANPPCLGFMMRPLTVRRDTYDNIITSRHFTINLVREDMIDEAHQTSAKYDKDTSEFAECGFTETYIDAFPAPYVEQCSIKIGMMFLEEHFITINETRLIVGQIEHLILPDDSIDKEGHIDHSLLKSTVVSGLDDYYSVIHKTKKAYARVNDQSKAD
jgi:flavin reductase (DIM6/NTAB) family NADH-FMN oxidoreductase RutF